MTVVRVVILVTVMLEVTVVTVTTVVREVTKRSDTTQLFRASILIGGGSVINGAYPV